MFSPCRTLGSGWGLNTFFQCLEDRNSLHREPHWKDKGQWIQVAWKEVSSIQIFYSENNHWMCWRSRQWQCSGWERTESSVISPRLASPWKSGTPDLLRFLLTWGPFWESLYLPLKSQFTCLPCMSSCTALVDEVRKQALRLSGQRRIYS